MPGGASLRMLSVMAEPSATTPFTTTGAEVSLASPGNLSGHARVTVISPLVPKPGQRLPLPVSSAIRRESAVPIKTRLAQRLPGAASGSCQALTPRQLYWKGSL